MQSTGNVCRQGDYFLAGGDNEKARKRVSRGILMVGFIYELRDSCIISNHLMLLPVDEMRENDG